MIYTPKLNKAITFSLSATDKKKLQEKAEDLGMSLSQLCRNIVLNKYQNLVVGYLPDSRIKYHCEVDVEQLNPPTLINSKYTDKLIEYANMKRNAYKEVISELELILKERKRIVEEFQLIES